MASYTITSSRSFERSVIKELGNLTLPDGTLADSLRRAPLEAELLRLCIPGVVSGTHQPKQMLLELLHDHQKAAEDRNANA